MDPLRRGNYDSGQDYVLEYGELRFTFNERDFSERVEQAARQGRVIHVDHFGNATTNIPVDVLGPRPQATIHINRRSIGKLKKTYWDVAPGKPLALIGSSGLLEIAVRDGSAKEELKVRVGDAVALR